MGTAVQSPPNVPEGTPQPDTAETEQTCPKADSKDLRWTDSKD